MNSNISERAKYLLTKARSKMIVEEPFYGNLSMRLELVETDKFPCMATDGRYQLYNPAWVAEQPVDKLACVLAHEVTHLTLHHQLRRNGRDYKVWNEACDYSVNAELKTGGWEIPEEALHNPLFDGMAAEQVYASLINEQKEEGGGEKKEEGQPEPGSGDQGSKQQGEEQTGSSEKAKADPNQQGTGQGAGSQAAGQEIKPAPGQEGQVLEPLNEGDHAAGADAWNQAVVAAARQAEKAGKLPGNIARRVQKILHPPRNWREELRHYFRSTAIDELNYSRFNRRYVDLDLYLPSMQSETMGNLVIAIDTSGSINDVALVAFMVEMESILQEVHTEEVTMFSCDYNVQSMATSYDGCLPADFVMKGGGGTRFSPVFERVEELGLNPELLIYFTDLRCHEAGSLKNPGYDVVWVKWGTDRRKPSPSIGQVLEMS
jgi:predicted metal-dependent peptidase